MPTVAVTRFKASGSSGNVQFNNNTYIGGSNNLFWDNVNSRLGIGTTVPASLLDLSATTPVFRMTDTTALAKSLLVTVDANTVQFEEVGGAANDLLVLDLANARIGVNTVTPARPLDILNTTVPPLRLSYSSLLYSDFQTTSEGNLYINASNGKVGFGTSDPYGAVSIVSDDANVTPLTIELANSGARQLWDKSYFALTTPLNPGVQDFSFESWIYPDNVTTGTRVLIATGASGVPGDDGFMIWQNATQIGVRVNDSVSATSSSGIWECGLAASTWYQVAFAADRDGSGVLYVNATSKGTVNLTGQMSSLGTTGTSAIGGYASSGNYFQGRIQNFRYWENRCLTSADVTGLYNYYQPLQYDNLSTAQKVGLVANWNCNDSTGVTLINQCGTNSGVMVADELFGNTGFDSGGAGYPDLWSSWTEGIFGTNDLAVEGVIVDTGLACKMIQGNSICMVTQPVAVVGRYYTISCKARGVVGGELLRITGASEGPTSDVIVTNSYISYSATLVAGASQNPGFVVYTGSSSVYIDTTSCKAAFITSVNGKSADYIRISSVLGTNDGNIFRISGNGNIGIGTAAYATTNKLGVAGGVAIGASYVASTAPANGLLVEGYLGVGTVNPSAVLEVNGNIWPTADNTNYLGKNDDDGPRSWRGVIMKDIINSQYYRVEVSGGLVTAACLTD